MYDGDSPASQMLGMLCGHDPVTSYTSRHNVLLVKFHTDDHIQRTGFHATYTFQFLSTTTTSTTTPTASATTPRYDCVGVLCVGEEEEEEGDLI